MKFNTDKLDQDISPEDNQEWTSDCENFVITYDGCNKYTLLQYDDNTGDLMMIGNYDSKMCATKTARKIKKGSVSQ